MLAWILATYLLALAFVAAYLSFALWPPAQQLNEGERPIRIFGRSLSIQREAHILLIVLAMGLLGGSAYDLWTLSDNVSYLSYPLEYQRAFRETQAVWYVLRPWTSSFMSVIFYGFIRSGLLVANIGSGKEINVYGIAGIAGVSGFLSGQLYERFSNLLNH